MKQITNITEALAHTIRERKELETKEKALKHELQALLTKAGKDKEETPHGVFTIARRPYWEYSPAVTDRIESLKADIFTIQEKAQHTGDATEKVTEYILFKEAKE